MELPMFPLELRLISSLASRLCGREPGPWNAGRLARKLSPVARKAGCASFMELYMLATDQERGLHARELLIRALTDHETSWFREPGHALLLRAWLEKLHDTSGEGPEEAVRIWCAAAATGQEPYSMAITALEFYREAGGKHPSTGGISILATDIDRDALALASRGWYSSPAMTRGLPGDLRGRYFTPRGEGWQLAGPVRELVTFHHHNILDPPGEKGPFDLVFLCNVLSGLGPAARKRALGHMLELLAPGGLLVLGRDEVPWEVMERLEETAHDGATAYRRRGITTETPGAAPGDPPGESSPLPLSCAEHPGNGDASPLSPADPAAPTHTASPLPILPAALPAQSPARLSPRDPGRKDPGGPRGHGAGMAERARQLAAAGRWDDLEELLTTPAGIEQQVEREGTGELEKALAVACEALPPCRPALPLLTILREALFADREFLSRHPRALFQCLWNRCWWCEPPEPGMQAFLEGWRRDREAREPGFRWLRSLRPPPWRPGAALIAVLKDHEDSVYCLSFSSRDSLLASCSRDGTDRIWDTMAFRQLHAITTGTVIKSLRYSPAGNILALGSREGGVSLRDAGTGEELMLLRGPEDAITALAFSPGGALLAAASRDGRAHVWDLERGCPVCFPGRRGAWMTGLAFSPSGRMLATVTREGRLSLWDMERGGAPAGEESIPSSAWDLAYSPDGSLIALAGGDGLVRILDGRSAAMVCSLQGHHRGQVTAVAWSPCGALLASASHDRTVRLWDPVKGAEIRCFHRHGGRLTTVAFSPSSGRLASACRDGFICLWRSEGRDPGMKPREDTAPSFLPPPPGPGGEGITAAALSPCGLLRASGSERGEVRLSGLPPGEGRILYRHQGAVTSLAFSPRGGRLLSGSLDGTAIIADAAGGEGRLSLQGHAGGVTAVAWAPCGILAASGSLERSVRIWHSMRGECLRRLEGAGSFVLALAFSPAGRRITAACADFTTMSWDMESGALLEVLEGIGDTAALADRETFPWRALARGEETVVIRDGEEEPAACWPSPLEEMATGPGGRSWEGFSRAEPGHLHHFTLEGAP